MASKSIYEILTTQYPGGQCVIMEEVSNATGHSRSRSLDYMVMNLWKSRGIHLTGIELKSFRGDWLKELKNPAKQEDHFKFCDYFYLLTTDESIAKIEEIPEQWGWMVISGNRIKYMKPAPRLLPEPVTKDFLACLLRRADSKDGWIKRDTIQDEIKAAADGARKMERDSFRYAQEEHDRLRKILKEFEEASGIQIDQRYKWNHDHKKIGALLKIMLSGNAPDLIREMKMWKDRFDKMKLKLDTDLQDLDKIIIEEE